MSNEQQIDMVKVKRLITELTGVKQTYKTLGEHLGVSDITLINWDAGRTKPELDKVLHILKLADCELKDILK